MMGMSLESLILSFVPAPATCAQRCYTTGSQGGCYCDSACTFLDDCCSDFDSICARTPGSENPGAGELILERMLIFIPFFKCAVLWIDVTESRGKVPESLQERLES